MVLCEIRVLQSSAPPIICSRRQYEISLLKKHSIILHQNRLIFMNYHTLVCLFFQKVSEYDQKINTITHFRPTHGKMSQNLPSAAFVIGALRLKGER